MPELPGPDPATADAADEHNRGEATGAPRWVKLVGTAAAVVVLLVVILLIVGGGSHGPGRHTGAGAAPVYVAQAPAASVGGHG